MKRSTTVEEKRLAELKKEVPTRGLERYPSFCNDISELSGDLRSPAVTALADSDPIQTIIAFPPQIQRGWHYVPRQALLFTPASVIHLQASIWPDSEPSVTFVKGCELLYMRISLILLYGLLEIVAQGQEEPKQISMEFNTVSWNYLSRPLRQFLRTTEPAPGMQRSDTYTSTTVKQAIENLPFKFSNGLRIYGLLPGEQLEEWLFQPTIRKLRLRFFWRPVSANTLLLLTTNYMVVIQEEMRVEQGWILTYIPRSNISKIQNRACELWNELSVQLRRDEQIVDYNLILDGKAAATWRTQWVQHDGQWQDLPGQPV